MGGKNGAVVISRWVVKEWVGGKKCGYKQGVVKNRCVGKMCWKTRCGYKCGEVLKCG